MSESCRALIIGFGNVGRRLCELLGEGLLEHPQLAQLDLKLVGVFTRSHGAWVNEAGIDPAQAVSSYHQHGCFPQQVSQATSLQAAQAVAELPYDVLIELSTLSIEDGGQPALGHVQTALQRGCHVVTANKGPAAFALRELQLLALRKGVQFRFESTVLDGCPLFNLIENCLSSARILRLQGILNCTSNFVLTRGMLSGNWREALEEARNRGFAESDPSHDLLGWDSAAKLAILCNQFLGGRLSPLEIPRQEVDEELIQNLRDRWRDEDCWRLIARAECGSDDRVDARVELLNLSPSHPFRTLTPASGGLLIETDLTCPLFIGQQDPTLTDTAFGVLQDLWSIFCR